VQTTDRKFYNFFVLDEKTSQRQLIAREFFENDVLVERQFLHKGKKHGVHQQWHINGQLKAEEQYSIGVMDGLFHSNKEISHPLHQLNIVLQL